MISWQDIYNRCDKCCVVCQATEHDGTALGVVSIFRERPIDPASFHDLEFVVLCYQDKEMIEEYHSQGLHRASGVIKKYLRIRGDIVHAIDRSRKEAVGR